MFLFETGQIGFDALFIDYYTNQRYTIEQEIAADAVAFKIIDELGLKLDQDGYRQLFRLLQDESAKKKELSTANVVKVPLPDWDRATVTPEVENIVSKLRK